MATNEQKRAVAIQVENYLNSDVTDYKKIVIVIGSSGSGVIGFDTTRIFNQATTEKDKFFHAHQTKMISSKDVTVRNMRRIELLLRFVRDHQFIWRLDGDRQTGIVKLTLQKPGKFLKKNHQQIITDLLSILKPATGQIKFTMID